MAAAGRWLLWRASARGVRCWLDRQRHAHCRGATDPDRIDRLRPLRDRSGQGRGDVLGRRRLRPAGAQARRRGRFRSDRGRHHPGDPLQAPVEIPVDEIAEAVPDYVGSARRDPDGMAIRLSLSRRVTINTMTAGERIFVDLLPDSWSGAPPSLPQDVIKELAERARAAERALRVQRATDAAKKRAADSRPRIGAADLRSLRVRNARRRQRLLGPERAEAHVVLQCRAQFRPRRRQDSRACERRLDQPEGHRRAVRGGESH